MPIFVSESILLGRKRAKAKLTEMRTDLEMLSVKVSI